MSKSQPWDYFPLPPIFAFTDEKKARKFIKKKFGIKRHDFGDSDGRCVCLQHDDSMNIACVVLLRCADLSTAQKFAVLAHECVHAVSYWLDEIGESSCGDEVRAYAVQAVMLACIKQIGMQWFVTRQTSKSSEK